VSGTSVEASAGDESVTPIWPGVQLDDCVAKERISLVTVFVGSHAAERRDRAVLADAPDAKISGIGDVDDAVAVADRA
jgi:hypothetical protein